MKRKRLAFILSTVFCIVFFTAIFTGPVFSQEPQISVFTEIKIKPGMNIEFEKFLKEEVIPAMKKGGQQELSVWKTAIFGDGVIYSLSSSITDFSQFDSPHPVLKALGPYGAQAMLAKMETYAKSMRTFMMRSLPDLQINAPEEYSEKLGLQVKATITPGQGEKYEKDTRVIKEIMKKIGAKSFLTGRVGVGGNPNQYYFFVLLDSFADLQSFGMAFEKAVSETKMPDMTGIVQQMEYTMYSYAPELSIQPAAQ